MQSQYAILTAVAILAPAAGALGAPTPVTVTNSFLPVRVTNTGGAINVKASGSATAGIYITQVNIYTNTGTRPVMFTGLSVLGWINDRPCANATTPPMRANFSVSDSPGGTAKSTMWIEMPAGRDSYQSDCRWNPGATAAAIVVGPGESLVGYGELLAPPAETYHFEFNASGYRIP
jgi:hypothetical protein